MKRGLKTMAAMGLGLLAAGCDTGLGIDLTGLWVANSYEYRSDSGQTVDLVERDGASFSLTVSRTADGRRQVTAAFDDGMGGREVLTGEVFVDDRLMTFETEVFDFVKDGDVLTMTNTLDDFDFGSGSESATLTIRLTQL